MKIKSVLHAEASTVWFKCVLCHAIIHSFGAGLTARCECGQRYLVGKQTAEALED